MKPVAFDAGLRARLVENLARLAPAPLDAPALKRAAVCVIVTDDGRGEAALLLTRRAEHLSTHSGQFALPGGRIDRGESALAAARREALEEIGLALAAGPERWTAMEGGAPILVDRQCVGGVGVSGGDWAFDERTARAAVEAIGAAWAVS